MKEGCYQLNAVRYCYQLNTGLIFRSNTKPEWTSSSSYSSGYMETPLDGEIEYHGKVSPVKSMKFGLSDYIASWIEE